MTRADPHPPHPPLPQKSKPQESGLAASLAVRPRHPGSHSPPGPIICSLWNGTDNAAFEALMSPMVPEGKKEFSAAQFQPVIQRQRPPLSLRHLVLICDLLSMRTTSRVCYMVSPLNITYENPGVPLITGRGEEGTLLLCGHCDQRDQLAERVSTGKCLPFTAGTPGSFTIPTTLHSPDTKYPTVSLPAGSPDSCPFLWYLLLHTDTLYFYKDRFLHWKNAIFTHYDFTWGLGFR